MPNPDPPAQVVHVFPTTRRSEGVLKRAISAHTRGLPSKKPGHFAKHPFVSIRPSTVDRVSLPSMRDLITHMPVVLTRPSSAPPCAAKGEPRDRDRLHPHERPTLPPLSSVIGEKYWKGLPPLHGVPMWRKRWYLRKLDSSGRRPRHSGFPSISTSSAFATRNCARPNTNPHVQSNSMYKYPCFPAPPRAPPCSLSAVTKHSESRTLLSSVASGSENRRDENDPRGIHMPQAIVARAPHPERVVVASRSAPPELKYPANPHPAPMNQPPLVVPLPERKLDVPVQYMFYDQNTESFTKEHKGFPQHGPDIQYNRLKYCAYSLERPLVDKPLISATYSYSMGLQPLHDALANGAAVKKEEPAPDDDVRMDVEWAKPSRPSPPPPAPRPGPHVHRCVQACSRPRPRPAACTIISHRQP